MEKRGFMIFTVDRVQFDSSGELLFYEFFNREKDNIEFVNQKCAKLLQVPNARVIGISYDDSYLKGSNISVVTRDSKTEYTWNDYQKRFLNKNSSVMNNIDKNSKVLGTATINEGDPFVHGILKIIHNIDFSLYDSGLNITKTALQNESTFGFDFDLFDNQKHKIIEFLKNETKQKGKNPLDNLKAHPMRYSWISDKEQLNFKISMNDQFPNWRNPRKQDNKQKYISLWNAKKLLDGDLYLVNYSDNYESEDLSIIHVIELDVNKGFMSDISYKVTYNELVTWLDIMNKAPLEAKAYLSTFHKEVRNNKFWNEYYQNQINYDIPKRSHIGTNYK